MKLLKKLEKTFGRMAIPNLMTYIVAILLAGFAITYLFTNLLDYLYLDFGLVAKGEIWRLFTYIIPVGQQNILLFAITTYFYYRIGNELERVWGAFRFNLYIFSAMFFNFIGSLIMYYVFDYILSPSIDIILGTLFFAYAAIYPNVQILLYFLIPIKIKYIAWLQGGLYIFQIVQMIRVGQYLSIIPIVLSVANFLIFFFATRNYKRVSPYEMKRKADFRRQMNEGRNQGNVTQFRGKNVITRHKCAVCGRTELDNDQLEFRFCSKCDGNYEYCMDHLFTHEHVHK